MPLKQIIVNYRFYPARKFSSCRFFQDSLIPSLIHVIIVLHIAMFHGFHRICFSTYSQTCFIHPWMVNLNGIQAALIRPKIPRDHWVWIKHFWLYKSCLPTIGILIFDKWCISIFEHVFLFSDKFKSAIHSFSMKFDVFVCHPNYSQYWSYFVLLFFQMLHYGASLDLFLDMGPIGEKMKGVFISPSCSHPPVLIVSLIICQ